MKENRRSFLKALGIFIPASSLIAKSYGDGIESKVEWNDKEVEESSSSESTSIASSGEVECKMLPKNMPPLWQHTPDRKV